MSNQTGLVSVNRSAAFRRAAVVGGLVLSLAAGTPVASADPDLGPAVNTTCSYPQVVAAMNAQSPEAAARFNASPVAQAWLQRFLAAPPAERQQMAQQAQSMPGAQRYIGLVSQIAKTCNNY
jgi:hemophore-related protein